MPEPASGYTCQEVVRLASEYLEGALGPDEATAFEVHLNFCDGCVDQLRETGATAGALPEEQISDELKARLLVAFRDWKRL
jgi:hypothetical protein